MTICCNGTQSIQNEKKVFIKQLDFGYKEYFVCYDNDTSQCSCIFSPDRDYGLCVKLYRSPNEKYFFRYIDKGRNRQTLWGGCTDANPKLLLNDT